MGLLNWLSKRLRGRSAGEPQPVAGEAERRDYERSELGAYDGSDPQRPLLIAVRGEVYDVTRGRHFYGPGGPYAVFAGKDCTRALAKMSFDAADFTGSLESLSQEELDNLEDWIERLRMKYRLLGRLLDDD